MTRVLYHCHRVLCATRQSWFHVWELSAYNTTVLYLGSGSLTDTSLTPLYDCSLVPSLSCFATFPRLPWLCLQCLVSHKIKLYAHAAWAHCVGSSIHNMPTRLLFEYPITRWNRHYSRALHIWLDESITFLFIFFCWGVGKQLKRKSQTILRVDLCPLSTQLPRTIFMVEGPTSRIIRWSNWNLVANHFLKP